MSDTWFTVLTYLQRIQEADTIDIIEQELLFYEYYEAANMEQRNLIDQVIREILYNDTGSNVFCLTTHAGCGKTFTQTAIIHKLNSFNLRCMVTAFSGIVSTFLLGGRTLHNVYKLSIPILENSIANITASSSYGRYINSSSLIIIDEVSLCPLQGLKIIDRLCRICVMKMININHLEEKRFFCAVIFGKSHQLSHMDYVEL